MGETLDKPKLDKKSLDFENSSIKYGISEVQGWKNKMENFTIKENNVGSEKNIHIFGIFDGHGGPEVPRYISSHFTQFLYENNNFQKGNYNEALKETFINLDCSFCSQDVKNTLNKYSKEYNQIINTNSIENKINQKELETQDAEKFYKFFDPRNLEGVNIAEFSGCSGIVALIVDKMIYIAYAGNSRCLVVDKGGIIIEEKTTKDHTILNPDEKKRIKKLLEDKNGENLDYFETMACTRGFGDLCYKEYKWINKDFEIIIPDPTIIEIHMDDVGYLIIGNHGIFESEAYDNKTILEQNQNIVNYFAKQIENNNEEISKIIGDFFDKLIPKIKENNDKIQIGLDNMSCIVVQIKNNSSEDNEINLDDNLKVSDGEKKKEDDDEEENEEDEK